MSTVLKFFKRGIKLHIRSDSNKHEQIKPDLDADSLGRQDEPVKFALDFTESVQPIKKTSRFSLPKFKKKSQLKKSKTIDATQFAEVSTNRDEQVFYFVFLFTVINSFYLI
jgi:hypothetical protein